MNPTNLTILGSTGSIGSQALDIVREYLSHFSIRALSAHSSWQLLADQVNEFRPTYAVLVDDHYRVEFEDRLEHDGTEVIYGSNGLEDLAEDSGTDCVLNSLVGFSGFIPTVKALKSGKKVALANKESLVIGGSLILKLLEEYDGQLIPVDSEHSAMLQCLVGESTDAIEKIVITASGGPFREWTRKQMKQVTVEKALDHPNWSMGAKITIDSATMMNKGLEIIETYWLFDLPLSKIEAVIHPQSIIHSIVTFTDGSSKAQLGPPDMKVPIQYALTYPGRSYLKTERLDWSRQHQLTFEPVDYDRFPCLRLARESLQSSEHAPAVLNAANEIAVYRFLNEEIDYMSIPRVVEASLEQINYKDPVSIESLQAVDKETRAYARDLEMKSINL